MLTAQVEEYSKQLVQSLVRLNEAHWLDLGLVRDKMPLAPDYEFYQNSARRGELCIVTLREPGAIVGYVVGFVGPGLHYQTTLTFRMDLIWVEKNSREQGGGLLLMQALERELLRRGVKACYMGGKVSKPIGRFYSRLGYEPSDVFYFKWLGD